MAHPIPADPCPSRRAVMHSALTIGGIAVLPGVVTACAASAGSDPATAALAAVQGAIVPTADIPVGGTIISTVNGAPLVLAQPESGTYAAFSAICTHQGAIVATKEGLILRCPAHGSEFDAGQGGKATARPATEPLLEIPVAANGDELVLG